MKVKKAFKKKSVVVIALLLSYFLLITVSRFSDNRNEEDQLLIINYGGQSLLNYLYFYDNHPYIGFNIQRIFPLTYQLFSLSPYESVSQLDVDSTAQTGEIYWVFSPFFGRMSNHSANYVGVIFCIVFSLICLIVLRNKKYDFPRLVLLACLAIVPASGVFDYYYASHYRVIAFLSFLAYYHYTRRYYRKISNY